jgi:hypothetical protein
MCVYQVFVELTFPSKKKNRHLCSLLFTF